MLLFGCFCGMLFLNCKELMAFDTNQVVVISLCSHFIQYSF